MADTPQTPPGWERDVLEKIALEGIKEQRRRRRWGIFFKFLGVAYLSALILMFSDWGSKDKSGDGRQHTALIKINGAIMPKSENSAENVVSALDTAFADKNTAGVILDINSPGGSPVQSGIINDEMLRLRAKYPSIPLYVVVDDICASGGYYIAVAGNKIFVNKASLVGSIGVIMNGFGFTGTMEKLGVERRLVTAGENKAFLDPFSPQSAKHKAFAQDLLNEIHAQFIDVVRKGRGNRLKETPDMFSGLVWSGSKGIELGLVDDYGTVDSVARDVIKVERVRDFTVKQGFAEKVAKQFGAAAADGALEMLNRFSLN